MEVAEVQKESSTAQNQIQTKREPFFNKDGQDGFFSKSNGSQSPKTFFSPTTIQPKLTVGQPNDKYEVEADSMADKVVQRLSQNSTSGNSIRQEGHIQKKCSSCEEEEKLQKKEEPLSETTTNIQRKPIFESNGEQPEPEIQTQLLSSPVVQQKCAKCEEEGKLQKKENEELLEGDLEVQKKEAGSQTNNSTDLEGRLNSSKGKGSSLPSHLQKSMGSEFGADFSNVKVHTGSEAIQMNKELGAHAFTHGNDIYFNQGKYDTSSTNGKHLLAHELTHTVQQNKGKGTIRRREFGPLEDTASMREGDWAHGDRLIKSDRWKQANDYNLKNGRSSQYTQIAQRKDFYLWYYETMRSRGHEIRWPLAAYAVAGAADIGANLDPGGTNLKRTNRLEQFMRTGNQVIFDDVFPKLRRLYLSQTILTGDAAQSWDMQTLIEEQNLIQPLYSQFTPNEIEDFSNLAKQKGVVGTLTSPVFLRLSSGEFHSGGAVPAVPEDYDITNPEDRFRYGMALANYFSSEEQDFQKSREWAESLQVPEPSEEYKNGEMLARYDRFDKLHELTTLISDGIANLEDIKTKIHQLSEEERRIIITDPWYNAMLRHRHGLSSAAAEALLNSTDISECGPLFKVIGTIEGTGRANAEDNIIVMPRQNSSWTAHGGRERIQVQAVSQPAYTMFSGVPLRYVWKDSLHCYPRKRPTPIPDPVNKHYEVFFDTGKSMIVGDSNEFANREILNMLLTDLHTYGTNPRVSNISMEIIGHASPRWRGARTSIDAIIENDKLSKARSENTRRYVMHAYRDYEGPVPLIVIDPVTVISPLDEEPNTTPATSENYSGKGSEIGLTETMDPDNDDQRYRKVEIKLSVIFEATTLNP